MILKASYNRGGDETVCLVAVARRSRNCIDGLRRELATISRFGVSPAITILFNGAGSSEYDRSTLRDYTTFLREVTSASWGSALRSGLPVLGVDGTFAKHPEGLAGRRPRVRQERHARAGPRPPASRGSCQR